MSKSAVGGRGRGWLNLNKSQHVPGYKIGPVLGNESNNLHSPLIDENQFVDAPEYNDIIGRVKELSVNDDGIKFNQKIKYILENWEQDCQTSEDVEKSFDNLFQACLNDEELASKLVIMIASRSFVVQEIHGQNIRLLFLRKLQKTFEDCKPVHQTNPLAFRNNVLILGEFLNKARLVNGQPLMFLAAPLIVYLEMLLESANTEDIQLFTTQLFLNGSLMKSECKDKLVELLIHARLLLVSNEKLTKESKLSLLMCIDVSTTRFCLLPGELHNFYLEHLGDKVMANFQGTPVHLSVCTQQNKTLDIYKSNVNVLQISDTPESDDTEHTSQSSNCDTNTSSQGNSSLGYNSNSNSADESCQNASKKVREASHVPAQYGRPILGAGARLNKNKTPNDRGNAKGWSNKPKGGDLVDRKKLSKGWEHDDRFENDYS